MATLHVSDRSSLGLSEHAMGWLSCLCPLPRGDTQSAAARHRGQLGQSLGRAHSRGSRCEQQERDLPRARTPHPVQSAQLGRGCAPGPGDSGAEASLPLNPSAGAKNRDTSSPELPLRARRGAGSESLLRRGAGRRVSSQSRDARQGPGTRRFS